VVGLAPCWLWQVVGNGIHNRKSARFSRFSRWLFRVVIAQNGGIFMKRRKTANLELNGPDEIKARIPVWLYPSTIEVMDRALETANCKSRSEFLEKAALFYAGYVSGQDACEFLPAALTAAMRGTIHESENRTSRLLFKLAVELDMVMNVLAAGMEIPQEDLDRLRGRCVRDVKSTNGSISLKDAVDYQRGGA
jgi:hypothetical protein